MAKVQVGLLGSARSLQRDLERIAKRADTNSSDGLAYVLQGASLHRSNTLRFARHLIPAAAMHHAHSTAPKTHQKVVLAEHVAPAQDEDCLFVAHAVG